MKSTFTRAFSIAAAIFLLAVMLIGIVFPLMVEDYLQDSTISNLEKDAQVISRLATAYSMDASVSSREFLRNLDIASEVSDADAVICNSQGFVVLCSDALTGCEHQGLQINREYLHKILENGGDSAIGIIKGLYTESRYVVSLPIYNGLGDGFSGIVIVSTPTEPTNQILQRISNIFMSAGISVVVLSILAVSVLSQYQSQPLKEMAKTANSFGHGDLDARVRLSGTYSEEIDELALAFNNMASLLQKSEYQRQEFVANVSHELKTPMTTISGYVDGILDGTIPEHLQSYYLQIVSDETKRLSRLVRSMLDISKLQDQEIPEDKKMHFDLEECAGQVLITFEKKITDKNLNVEVDLPLYPIYTWANQDYITQVIYNLIDNAVKFCPEGGTLGLSIREGGGKAYISIANDGDTIPPEELPLVFDRFHKLDKSRSQNREGWGLGLYIVKTIVCSHGENISVTSKNGRTEFTFTMPIVN